MGSAGVEEEMKRGTGQTKERPLRREFRLWLETASRWRVLSLLFQLPTSQSRRELSRLADGFSGELEKAAKEWARIPLKEAEAQFHRAFGPGGIPATESSYDPNALAGRGPLLADIAGFHEAFAYRPEMAPGHVPDHIAAEADLLSFLAFKVAFAVDGAKGEEAGITAAAYGRFLQDHVRTWLPAFQERVERSGLQPWVRVLPSLHEAALNSGGCAAPGRAGSRD
jgi:TorA maturation chaperone TorD